jgi:hypothetical protein
MICVAAAADGIVTLGAPWMRADPPMGELADTGTKSILRRTQCRG